MTFLKEKVHNIRIFYQIESGEVKQALAYFQVILPSCQFGRNDGCKVAGSKQKALEVVTLWNPLLQGVAAMKSFRHFEWVWGKPFTFYVSTDIQPLAQDW